MTRLRPFIAGILAGLLITLILILLVIRFLPNFLVANHLAHQADAIVVLGGDGHRLQAALQLHDQKFASRLILTCGKQKDWAYAIKKYTPDNTLENRGAVFIEGSKDTRTDAQITLKYCQENNLNSILVVTSPYHTRRAQFVFNKIFDDSDIEVTVLSTGDYGHLKTPNDKWWFDRSTVEYVWLEFGKILYWELTPFMEFHQGGH